MRCSDVVRYNLACRCIRNIVSTEIESTHFSVQFLRVLRLEFVQFIFETPVSQSTENDVGSVDGRPIADEILIGIHTFQCHVGDAQLFHVNTKFISGACTSDENTCESRESCVRFGIAGIRRTKVHVEIELIRQWKPIEWDTNGHTSIQEPTIQIGFRLLDPLDVRTNAFNRSFEFGLGCALHDRNKSHRDERETNFVRRLFGESFEFGEL